MNELFKKYNLRGDRLRPARLLNYGLRTLTRIITYPATFLSEGPIKTAIRTFILNFQNSLPIELVVSRGSTAVYIGMPWPYTLRRLRRAVGRSGQLVIVEAMSDNIEALKQTIKTDGYKNVILFEGAAWSERKSGTMLVSSKKGDHRIKNTDILLDNDLRSVNACMREIEMELFPLDEILNDFGISRINHLSVTVNGAEYEVLLGAKNIIENSNDLLLYSKAHARNKSGEPISRDIISYLESLGCKTKLTKGEPSSTKDRTWRYRDGDVFAWKQSR